MKASLVITYHEEGKAFISECIDQIYSTIDIDDFEVIIVDDGSVRNILNPTWFSYSNIKCIKQTENKGVGQAFDLGISHAQSDNILFFACDIRFIANKWCSQMIDEIEKYPTALMASSCINLNAEKLENLDLNIRRKISVVNGARILIFHDQKSNPRMTSTFRGILEAQWLSSLRDRDIDSFEIPCILGAFYGVKKSWYQYIDGFWGHKKWGTLEVLISMKSWLFGGSCRTAPRIETGHIFKKVGWHGTPQDALMYNKMLTATLLFDDYDRLISFLGSNTIVERGRHMYQSDLPDIMKKREEYKEKTVFSMEEYIDKWQLDYRK